LIPTFDLPDEHLEIYKKAQEFENIPHPNPLPKGEGIKKNIKN
jgi:hypothetical protein